mmetsp:Transcript_21338/g.46621  ORF Transcript_21338/g.46621 Transcript_21338/m.46621 type:complete len:317 (-) Transcript_21338:361-1311(-)
MSSCARSLLPKPPDPASHARNTVCPAYWCQLIVCGINAFVQPAHTHYPSKPAMHFMHLSMPRHLETHHRDGPAAPEPASCFKLPDPSCSCRCWLLGVGPLVVLVITVQLRSLQAGQQAGQQAPQPPARLLAHTQVDALHRRHVHHEVGVPVEGHLVLLLQQTHQLQRAPLKSRQKHRGEVDEGAVQTGRTCEVRLQQPLGVRHLPLHTGRAGGGDRQRLQHPPHDDEVPLAASQALPAAGVQRLSEGIGVLPPHKVWCCPPQPPPAGHPPEVLPVRVVDGRRTFRPRAPLRPLDRCSCEPGALSQGAGDCCVRLCA